MSSVFLGILRMEWRYQVRQLAFPVAVIGFAAWAVMLVGTGYGPDNAAVNSPYVIMQSMGLITLPVIFLLTITCTSAALRDVEHRMAELVWSTPAGRLRYLGGRFGGAMLAALTVLAAATIALALAPHLVAAPPERLGAFRPLAYLWAWLLVALPGTLLFGSIIFAVAALSRSNVAAYVAGVGLYALYFVTALLVDSPLMANAGPATPEALARAAILDPLGLSAFFEQARYWGAAERNGRMIALDGHLLMNRVLWLAVAVAAMVVVARKFSFSMPGRPDAQTPTRRPGVLASRRFRPLRLLRHLRPSSSALFAMWAFVIGMEFATSFTRAEYFTAIYPTTGFLVNTSLFPLGMFGTLALTWFASEIVWRARAVRMADILDATPASSYRFYLQQLQSLVVLVLLLIAVTIVIGVAMQVANGYLALELPLWLSLFPLAGIPLVLVAVLVLLVQSLSPNRWVGLVLSLLLIVGLSQAKDIPALSHPMLRYGAAPALEWSDMNGYGAALRSWSWFMMAWTAAAIVLALCTIGAWPRGRGALAQRFRRFRPTLGSGGQASLVTAAAAFVAIAGIIWQQTTRASRYETSRELAEWKVGYERAWRHTEGDPTPVVIALKASLDLYPREQRYTMRGRLTLANRTARPIDTVRVVTRRDIAINSLVLAGARQLAFDSTYRVGTWVLAAPLAPGSTGALDFDLTFSDGGLRADGYDNTIVSNGTFVMSHQVVPSLGYRSSYELSSAFGRRHYGLPPASAITPLDTTGRTRAQRNEEWFTLDVTISTDAGQQVVASGTLERQWQEGGRHYFHYVTPEPVTGRFGFASARYAVERTQAEGVAVEIYYNPAHRVNVPAMLDAAVRSLRYFQRAFGPYQFPTLRIAEVPSYLGAGALALPGAIYFVEDRGFMTDARDSTRFDLITRRMAHEVSHQWWGHQLSPADAEGATMLVETLAKYSEQLVLRERRGKAMLEPLLAVDADNYRRGAADDLDDEPGLYRVADQDYIYYGKGGVVMHQLTDSLGEAALNRSLRTLVERFGGSDAVPPTTLDLLDILHADTPPSRHAFIDRSLREAGLLLPIP